MAVKKQKECCHGMHKIFMGLILIIAAIIFWLVPDFKDAWMYTFFAIGILFVLKGIYFNYM